MLTTLLTKLANSCWHYPKRVLAALVLPTLLLGAAAGQLRLDGSLLGAVNDDDPQVVRLKELKAQFPAGGTMALLIEGGTELERRAVAQAASAALRRQPSILSATYRLDPFLAYQHGPLLVDDATHNALKEQLEGLAFLLTQPQGSEALELIFSADEADPSEAGQILDMTELIAGDVPDSMVSRQLSDLPLRSGWFATPSGSLYVVDLRTRLDPIADPVGGDGFIPLKDALEPVKAAYPDVQMTFAGMVATAYEDQANVLSQLLPLSTVSMVLVLFLLSRLNRSLWSVLLTGAALGVALVWTFGLVHLVIGYASVMAAGFAILLFGLGIDHAAHLLLRFDRELRAGRAGDEAVRLMLVQTGRGVLVGGLTTSLAFGLMSFIDFKAAVHLGMTACMGMICTLITVMTILPAGLRLVQSRRQVPPEAAPVALIEGLTRWALGRPRTVIGASAVLLAVSAAAFPRFELETDLEAVMTQDLPSMVALRRLKAEAGLTTEAVLSAAPDLETARQRAERLEALPQVARVEGLHTFFPPDLERRIKRHQALKTSASQLASSPIEAIDAAMIQQAIQSLQRRVKDWPADPDWAAARARASRLITLLSDQSPEQLRQGVLTVRKALSAGLDSPVRTPDELPARWQTRYRAGGEYLSFVFPADERLAAESLSDFRRVVTEIDPKAAGGLFVVDYLLVGGVERTKGSLGLILLALFVMLFLDLRDPRLVAVALIPLICGSVVGLGVMLWLERPITLVMLSAFPLIFGIGIDDGVHLVHGWKEGGDLAPTVSRVGAGILFTSISTSLSFGVLLGLDHNGFEGLALLVILGVGSCFLASVTLLPVLAQRLLEPS